MNHCLRGLLGGALSLGLCLLAPNAGASFHTYQIHQIFSNADGTIQFVVLHEVLGENNEHFLTGHTLNSTQGGTTKTYTFNKDLPGASMGGYGGTPMPTAFTYVLIATQGFAALGLVTPDYVIPNGFLPLTNGTINYAGVDQVTYTALPTDGTSAINHNAVVVQNVARNFAGDAGSVAAAVVNYEGLWWNAPAASESGWGINFAHQGDIIFASWFTYDLTGKGWWLVMTAPKTAPNAYSGALYQTTGPPFNAVPFNPMLVTPTQVGTGTLSFSDANNGTFAYTVNGIAQTKNITREVFGPLPTCTFGAQPNLGLATNYQDLWWASPAGSESGWGVNFTHQGDTIFATWFTYDLDHTPMWLVVTAQKTAPGTYAGTLYRTTGPAFNAVPFNPANVVATAVGTATLSFTDGTTGTFAYTVNGISQTKAVTREVFTNPGTVCQ
jgi:hypothetical protein